MAFRESALRTCTERATSIMTFRKVPFPKLSLAPGKWLFGKVLFPQLFLRLGNDFRDRAILKTRTVYGPCTERERNVHGTCTERARYVHGTCPTRTSHGPATYRTLPPRSVHVGCTCRARSPDRALIVQPTFRARCAHVRSEYLCIICSELEEYSTVRLGY